MAHHQHQNDRRQTGGLYSFLNLFRLSNTPTVAVDGEEDVAAEVDEPPDDQVSPLQDVFPHKHDTIYKKSSRPRVDRRESLLTRALHGESQGEEQSLTAPSSNPAFRALSTTSTHSNASMASTAELTSDTGLTSPPRSATPSPPLPPTRQTLIPTSDVGILLGKEDLPLPQGDSNEVAVEKTLGRKRCIMFACGNAPEKATEPVMEPKTEVPATAPRPRPRMLTFACPSRESKTAPLALDVLKKNSPIPSSSQNSSSDSVTSTPQETDRGTAGQGAQSSSPSVANKTSNDTEPKWTTPFHEFGSSTDEPDPWVNRPADHQSKLTMSDCMKKELALRRIGKEAEEEAEQEEEEENDLEDGQVNDDNEDDFAPSDGSSDAGNESDNEEGFADSDDESNAESDYEFWAPSKANSTAATTTTNTTTTTTPALNYENITVGLIRAPNSQRHSVASSLESGPLESVPRPYPPTQAFKRISRRRARRISKMKPSTPELPDSTDFVCGTFDEDRPLEAAYISCREQRKREKHVPIPQDIDPSFPTTDLEDNDDNDDDAAGVEEEDDHLWLKDQLEGFDEDAARGRRNISTAKKSPPASPRRYHSPAPKGRVHRPAQSRQNTNRSPPPKHHVRRPSPAPGRLFGRSPTRMGSPPPPKRLRSPRGSPQMPLGITITRLAQRPNTGRTASLPHTPNPFFQNYNAKTPQPSHLTSEVMSPDVLSEIPDHEKHVRGAVDIVIGLEKKRQKRKEKFWRQHCRKAAKEQAERKPAPGRGVERMKELGLECAERTRAYGLGQPAQLVISL
jgi:hypothetical protein